MDDFKITNLKDMASEEGDNVVNSLVFSINQETVKISKAEWTNMVVSKVIDIVSKETTISGFKLLGANTIYSNLLTLQGNKVEITGSEIKNVEAKLNNAGTDKIELL